MAKRSHTPRTPAKKISAVLARSGMLTAAGAVLNGGLAAFAAAGEDRTTPDGQPIKSFRKDLLRVGDYVKASTDQRFSFDEADLLSLAATANKIIANGVKIPSPAGHTNDPRKNQGTWTGFEVEPDDAGTPTLFGNVDLVGDGIKLAGTAEVSVNIEPEFVDGKGRKYANAITHVALVTDPVVPDQKGFVAIAASREGDPPTKRPAYRLVQEIQDMDWKKLCAALGLDAGQYDDSTGPDAVLKEITKIKSGHTAMAKEKTEAEKARDAALARAKKAEAEKGEEAPEPTPSELRLNRKDREREIEKLRLSGHVSEKQAAKLRDTYIGTNGAALALTLDEGNVQRFEETIAIFAMGEPVYTGKLTPAQIVALGRQTPDDASDYDPKVTERMIAAANKGK